MINSNRLFHLTQKLIEIPSITADEKNIGQYLAEFLTDNGFCVSPQQVQPNRFNLIATLAENPVVFLCTHMDTVSPHIPFSADETTIYGRGACDAKGPLAAMIEALLTLQKNGETRIGLLIVVGEEFDSIGAKFANKEANFSSKYIIVGEPTDNKLAIGQKGTLLIRLKTVGVAAHSAFPELGQSAIRKLCEVLPDLWQLEFEPDSFFGESHLNIGTVSGGSKVNVIPARAEAEIIIRLAHPVRDVLERIRAAVNDRAEIAVISQSDPIRMPAVPGFATFIAGFGSDVPYLGNFGQPLLIGPGSIHLAHNPGESILKQELIEGSLTYLKLIRYLLST